MKKIKFTITNIDKQFELPLRNVETGQNFLDQLKNYWNLVNVDIKLHVNNGIAVNPNIAIIREDFKVQVQVIQAKFKITLKNSYISFLHNLLDKFGGLKKTIRDEIFSLPSGVDVFIFWDDKEMLDEAHVIDMVLNPCITCQIKTTIQFRSVSGIITKYIDLNDKVKNIIAEIQKSYKNKKIDQLKYDQLVMLPNDRPIQYIIKPNQKSTIDVGFEETYPEFLKLKVEYQDDNQTYQLKLSSKMEDLVIQIIKDFFQNVPNTQIKLKLNEIELPQTGLVMNIIGTKNEVVKIEKVSEGDKIIEIFLLKRGQTAIKTIKQIKLTDKVSTLNENFQAQIMNFYYNNNLLNKGKTFESQGIRQNEVEIEFEEIEAIDEKITFIDANTQENTVKTVNTRKNLHEIICEQIGYETDDYWVCIDYQQIMDTKKPLNEFQMNKKAIVYSSQDMILKVKYDGIQYDMNVNRELCVIDLFKVFKEKFQIPDGKQYQITHDGNQKFKDIVNYQLWAKRNCEFELHVKDSEEPKSELPQLQYLVKIEIPTASKTIDFMATITDPVFIFLDKLQNQLNLPINQPCELWNEGKAYNQTNTVQIKDLDLNQNFIFIIKEEIILLFQNKLNGNEEHYETLIFNEPFKQVKQSSKLFQQNDCQFYFKSQLIDIEKNIKDLGIYDLQQIEYEIISNNQEQSVQPQILHQESNQDIQLNQQLNELPQQIVESEGNDTNQNITILYKYQNQEFEMTIANNTKVKQLKEKIIDFHKCVLDIDLRQEGVILNDENVISQFKSIILVVPKTIKIIIKTRAKYYEQQFQLNAKIQELYDKMNIHYNFKYDLVFNDKILNPQHSIIQVGMTNNSVVYMKY